MKIEFSPHAEQCLDEIADYLYQQNCSKDFVLKYLLKFKTWLKKVLLQFPNSGIRVPNLENKFGKNIRRIVY